jgi:hypothetical protein
MNIPNPINYLGFPMIQSTQLRASFVGSFITKLRAAVQPHLSRTLSGLILLILVLFFGICTLNPILHIYVTNNDS